MKCRHCLEPLTNTFLDLGFAPPSNAYLTQEDLSKPEKYFPLKLKICDKCWLVQTEDYATANELFSDDYAYFSSTSSTWLAHAESFSKAAIKRFELDAKSHVIEIASNDGYLLRNFVAAGIPCLGIEPTASTAAAAEKLGVPVIQKFFDEGLGEELREMQRQADLIVGNNVYAHVPDINSFTRGLKAALKPNGIITLEFPHLMRMLEDTQFDTVYHEHFSYFSLFTVQLVFRKAGLRIWDVQELPTHGGSLRVFGCHSDHARDETTAVRAVLNEESRRGMQSLEPYSEFQKNADRIKNDFLSFLIAQKNAGKTVAAYGAAAKGNTLLNYAGIKTDLLPFVCDAAIAKQWHFMPGSHIPILPQSVLQQQALDYLIVLPWNLVDEIIHQNQRLVESGTKFIRVVPRLTVV